MRTDLTNAQATVQTLLLIIVSFVVAWLSVYRVPWQVSGDPCVLAAAATLVIVTCLWLTRWRGLPGLNSERNLLAWFLTGMPLVYVSRYLFTSIGRMANYWFWVRGSSHRHFWRSCRARPEALALVLGHRNSGPRISLGYLALPELDLHPRLVRNCLPDSGPRLRSICGRTRSRISERVAH